MATSSFSSTSLGISTSRTTASAAPSASSLSLDTSVLPNVPLELSFSVELIVDLVATVSELQDSSPSLLLVLLSTSSLGRVAAHRCAACHIIGSAGANQLLSAGACSCQQMFRQVLRPGMVGTGCLD